MALMVVLPSVVNPMSGRVLSMPASPLLLSAVLPDPDPLNRMAVKAKLDPVIWMRGRSTWIHLALAIGLNLWDTVPVRRLRARFLRKVSGSIMQPFGTSDRYVGKNLLCHHHDDVVHAGGVALRDHQFGLIS